jgi:hypothetical protein
VKVYFTGDTGYRSVPRGATSAQPHSPEEAAALRCPAFRQIGEAHGPLDMALLPIGAYSPRWLMSTFHASPEDAVEMHLDARARRSIGMHWGAFPLTDEPIEEPPARLAEALRRRGVPAEQFVAVRPGSVVCALAGPTDPDSQLVDLDPAAEGGGSPWRLRWPRRKSPAPVESIMAQSAAAAGASRAVSLRRGASGSTSGPASKENM